MHNRKDIARRYLLFLIGLFIASAGVAFSTLAGLGTSPVASVPYSVSLISGRLSFGGWLNLWSVLQITVQVILLRKKCRPLEILIQTVLAFAYGYMTNFSCFLLRGITAGTYPAKFMFMIISCFILGFGIWLQFKGGVAMLPGEAMNRAISSVTGKRYENIKILFDVIYILTSVALSLLAFGRLHGVREGSVIAAVLIGNIIRLYNFGFNKLTACRSNAEKPGRQEDGSG